MVQKCASSKKNLTIMVNVYKLSVSITEEEKILYPSPPPPPPPLTIITITTMMDLSRPSIEKNPKKKNLEEHKTQKKQKQKIRPKPKNKKDLNQRLLYSKRS
jgi:hypothetical protein